MGMLSDSLFDAKYGVGRDEPLLRVLRDHVNRMGNEIYTIFTQALPGRRGISPPAEIAEYQRRLRATGLVTFGYEHTQSLFTQLRLAEGQAWDPVDASSMPGWTTNARRTTCARRHMFSVGSQRLDDKGTIFTS